MSLLRPRGSIVLCALALIACTESKPGAIVDKANEAIEHKVDETKLVAPHREPLTEADARDFAMLFIDFAKSGDADSIASLFDLDGMARLGVQGQDFAADKMEPLIKGMDDGMRKTGAVAQFSTFGPTSDFAFLGSEASGEHVWVVIRWVDENYAYDQLRFLLWRSEDRVPRIIDMVTLGSSARKSDEIGMIVARLSKSAKTLESRLGGTAIRGDLAIMIELMEAQGEGKVEAWKAAYARLSPEARSSEYLLEQRAQMVIDDPKEFEAVLAELLNRYPDSRSAAYTAYLYELNREDWGAALSALDKVEATAHPDSYFKVERGWLRFNLGNYAEALSLAKAALESDPSLTAAVDLALFASLSLGQFEVTTDMTLAMIFDRKRTVYSFEGVPEYADYRASKAYARLESEVKARDPQGWPLPAEPAPAGQSATN